MTDPSPTLCNRRPVLREPQGHGAATQSHHLWPGSGTPQAPSRLGSHPGPSCLANGQRPAPHVTTAPQSQHPWPRRKPGPVSSRGKSDQPAGLGACPGPHSPGTSHHSSHLLFGHWGGSGRGVLETDKNTVSGLQAPGGAWQPVNPVPPTAAQETAPAHVWLDSGCSIQCARRWGVGERAAFILRTCISYSCVCPRKARQTFSCFKM